MDSQRVIVKVHDKYQCDICKQLFISINLFKKHLFVRHSDLEVQVKYRRSMEKMIGPYMLKRLRDPMMNKVKNAGVM